MRIHDRLDAAPFDIDHLRSTVTLGDRFFVMLRDSADKPGLWVQDADGWTHLSSGAGKYNRDGDIAAANGDLYMAAKRGTLYRWDGEAGWAAVEGVGETDGILAGNEKLLVTAEGDKAYQSLIVVDPAAGSVTTVDLATPIRKRHLDIRLDEDGTLWAQNDASAFRVDLDDGAVTEHVDTILPDIFTETKAVSPPAPDGPGAATAVDGDGWFTLADGAPRINDVDGSSYDALAAVKGNLYVALENLEGAGTGDPSGLYRFDGDSWDMITPFTHRYGIKDMVAGDDGNLYVGQHDGLFRVDPETGTWLDTLAGSPLDGSEIRAMAAGPGSILVLSKDTDLTGEADGDLAISVFDIESGTWRHAPLDRDFGKTGHTDMLMAGDGALWLSTAYDGVYRAEPTDDGGFGAFAQVAPAHGDARHSGSIFTDESGAVHLSYETTKYTQISGVFRYEGESDWSQVHQDKGYNVDGHAVDGSDVTFMQGGRFPEYAFDGTKKWSLPEAPGGSDSFGEIASGDGVFYAARDINGAETLTALDVGTAVAAARPYDSDLTVQTARNLESADDKQAIGVEILADGRIVSGVTARDDGGRVDVISADGTETLQSLATGTLSDMTATPDGAAVYVGGADGVQRMDGDGTLEQVSAGAVDRVDVDADGRLATLSGKTVTVTGADGETLQTLDIDASYVEDVAIDAEAGMVYVVGFSNDNLPSGNPVQGPHLRAYDIGTGEMAWSRFEFGGGEKASNIADGRLYNVEIGQDGELYVLGESAGTETIFRYDGTELSGEEIVTKIDHHNDLWNTKSAHIAYHARIDKTSGDVQDAQLTMPRLPSSGLSNTFRVGDIAADTGGRVYIGGETAASLANRDGISINGQDVPDYDGSDPAFMALRPDFTGRMAWHSLDAGNADGEVAAVATRGGKTVLLSDYADGELFTTEGPGNDGGSAAHLTVIDGSAAFGLPAASKPSGAADDATEPTGTEEPVRAGDDPQPDDSDGTTKAPTEVTDGGRDETGDGETGGDDETGGDGETGDDEAAEEAGTPDLVMPTHDWRATTPESTTATRYTGNPEAETLTGDDGADVFLPGGGDDTIDGGAGLDSVVLSQDRAAYDVGFGDGGATVSGAEGDLTMDGVERVVFTDGVLASPTDETAVRAYRLYEATFDRAPDAEGLGYWIGELDAAENGRVAYDVMVKSFMGSEEFGNLYGQNVSDAGFVEALYQNVLDRAPDAAGEDYWLGEMEDGLARWQVLASFAESDENKAAVASQIDDGIWYG